MLTLLIAIKPARQGWHGSRVQSFKYEETPIHLAYYRYMCVGYGPKEYVLIEE